MTERWRPEVPKVRGYSVVALDNPKNPTNVGSAMRAVHCFGATMLAVSGKRFKGWRCTDTAKAWRHLPLVWTDDLQGVVPHDCIPVAVELVPRAVELHRYVHPERAFYVFGQEDGTLGDRVLSWCRDVVYIPTQNCLNLAACVNVVLYDRQTKLRQPPTAPLRSPEPRWHCPCGTANVPAYLTKCDSCGRSKNGLPICGTKEHSKEGVE